MKSQHLQTASQFINNNIQSMQNLPQSLISHCRICLQQDGKLIQLPCACIGQIGLVHEQCFTKWIQTFRNQVQGLRSNRANLSHVSQNSYQIPCQICRVKINIQMLEKRSCIGLKDLSKPQIILSITCIMFNLIIMGVTCYFCISSIVRGPSSALKIFINIFILVIMFIVLGWIIKRQIDNLIVKNIAELKISNVRVQIVNNNNMNNNNDQVADFVINDERQIQQGNEDNRSDRSNRRRRSHINRNSNNNQNNANREENRQVIIDI